MSATKRPVMRSSTVAAIAVFEPGGIMGADRGRLKEKSGAEVPHQHPRRLLAHAPARELEDLEHAAAAREDQRDALADTSLAARLDCGAVEQRVARLNRGGGLRAALEEPELVKQNVEAHGRKIP